jgi:hypothetical protein
LRRFLDVRFTSGFPDNGHSPKQLQTSPL